MDELVLGSNRSDDELEPRDSDNEFVVGDDFIEYESEDTGRLPPTPRPMEITEEVLETPPQPDGPPGQIAVRAKSLAPRESCRGVDLPPGDNSEESDEDQPFADLIGKSSSLEVQRGLEGVSDGYRDGERQTAQPPESPRPGDQFDRQTDCLSYGSQPQSCSGGADSACQDLSAADMPDLSPLGTQPDTGSQDTETAQSPLTQLILSQKRRETDLLEFLGDADEEMFRSALEFGCRAGGGRTSMRAGAAGGGGARRRNVATVSRSRTACLPQEQCDREWRRVMRSLTAEFCTGREARMLLVSEPRDTRSRGKPIYKGLPIETWCCADLAFVFSLVFEAITRDKPSTSNTYYQFRGTFGQLARGAVALEVINIEDMSKPGGVFKSFLGVDFIQALMRYFEE